MPPIIDTAGRAVFDASGRAVVTLGPPNAAYGWKPSRMSISTDSVKATQCNVYRNFESPSAFIAGTVRGNQNTSDLDEDLLPGQYLIFVWTGGTPGANATATVYGGLRSGRP